MASGDRDPVVGVGRGAVGSAEARSDHAAGIEVGGRGASPSRFGVSLLVAAAVPTIALFVVPQLAFASFAPLAVLLVVLGGAAAAGAAAAAVLRSSSQHPSTEDGRGANSYFAASGLCFVILCVVAPAAVLVGTFAWYDFRGLDPRGLVVTAVSSAALLLAAVFAIAGAVLLRTPASVTRLAWAKVDLVAQVFALAAVLATVAILY